MMPGLSAVPLGLHVGWIGLGTGTLVLLAWGRRASRPPWHVLLAILVPALTTLSYVAMTLGQGIVVLEDGRVYYWARWADAVIGASLLFLNTALIALPRAAARRNALLTGLVVATAIAMACALFAGASVDPVPRWTWYGLGAAAYSIALWLAFVRVPSHARRRRTSEDRRRRYRMLLRVLVGVSVFYPVWWVVAPTGLGWVTEATALLGFAGLDVMSKAGYGMLIVVETKGLAQLEAQTQTD